MDTVPNIMAELGGPTAISNDTGIPLTTVHSWKRTGFVPRWRVPTLVAMAAKLGKPITEDSFPKERPSAHAPMLPISDHEGCDTVVPQQASPGKIDEDFRAVQA